MLTLKIVIVFCSVLTYQVSSLSEAAAVNTTWSWEWAEDNTMPCSNPVFLENSMFSDYVFLGRAHHMGAVVPALVQPSNKTHPAIFNYEDQLDTVNSYEVMCGEGAGWQIVYGATSSKALPRAALPVGNMKDGTVLYACRHPNYITCLGLVDPVTHYCNLTATSSFITGFDRVVSQSIYEILIEP